MLVISSRVQIDRQGAEVALVLADQLAKVAGPPLRWVFLVGFWGAVFSSLLGVWQSAPYLFADFLRLNRHPGEIQIGNRHGAGRFGSDARLPGLSHRDRHRAAGAPGFAGKVRPARSCRAGGAVHAVAGHHVVTDEQSCLLGWSSIPQLLGVEPAPDADPSDVRGPRRAATGRHAPGRRGVTADVPVTAGQGHSNVRGDTGTGRARFPPSRRDGRLGMGLALPKTDL